MDIDNIIGPVARLLIKNWKENNDQEERDLLMQIYEQIIPEDQRVYQLHLPYFLEITDIENLDYDPDLDDEGDGDYNGYDDCEGYQSHDLSDDAEALASAGFGTDEDYGCYSDDSGW